MKKFIIFEDNTRMKFGMNQISNEIRLAGIGGPESIEAILTASMEDPQLRQASLMEKNIKTLMRQIQIEDTTFSTMLNHIIAQHERWAQSPSVWPCFGRVTSYFGERHHPLMETTMFHEGVDIANISGTPIFASANGYVSSSGTRGNYGNTVVIEHPKSGYMSLYAHMLRMDAKLNQYVKRGELIGFVGNSGLTTGPHLHYEIRSMGKPVDPMRHIVSMEEIVD
jgi:murein DD-endopeptidase MepM/ murein hydrolase activator NlpD